MNSEAFAWRNGYWCVPLFSTAMLALRSKQQHAILHLPLSHLSNQIKSQQCCMQGATAEDDEDAHAAAQAVG